jgi:4-hydroxyproline epimerase
MAQLHAKDALAVGGSFIHESIIGSLFTGRMESLDCDSDFEVIRPSISGWVRKTGNNTITVNTRDPFRRGFQVT